MKKLRQLLVSLMVIGMIVLSSATAWAQGGPVATGDHYIGPPGVPAIPDICNFSSIENWAETHSNGAADNGFDRVGGPKLANGNLPGGGDCPD